MNDPIIIGLNGHPGSGKSTVQDILHRRFKIKPIDDGDVIRRHCRELFGLSLDDTNTQEGKKRHTVIEGNIWENRKILGEYGNLIEETFGQLAIPRHAVREALRQWQTETDCLGYSFGSVRRGQGELYRNYGGIMVEISRPGVEPSGNLWDTFDQRWVNYTFVNDAHNIDNLEEGVVKFFTSVLDNRKLRGLSVA